MIQMFNATQTKDIDRYTVDEQDIKSVDLMERAAEALFDELKKHEDNTHSVLVFSGSGNNGGDALALARMLIQAGYFVEVYLVDPNHKMTDDCHLNKQRLEQLTQIVEITDSNSIPAISSDKIVIDGLFGVGINRPVEGLYLDVIRSINNSQAKVYSIDLPSGMFAEDNTSNNKEGIVKATCVLTIQYPKLALLLPHDESYYDHLKIIDIGLSKKCIDSTPTDYSFVEKQDVACCIKKRTTFSHKGTYGHALLIAGSYGKMGAAVLATKACLRAGAGLVTLHTPACGVNVIQLAAPEAMVHIDENEEYVTNLSNLDTSKMTIGIGPAIGQERATHDLLLQIFELCDRPMVIDADALNLVAQNDLLKRKIPKNSILTPHPVEFDRLIAKVSESGYLRLQYAREFAKEYQVYLILKGAYSALISPDGKVCFNSTGNPGMSTGGSGDTLTGILTSLLAQKYTPYNAMLIGAYLHGLAADLAIKEKSEESLLPTDIIDYIGKAYFYLKK